MPTILRVGIIGLGELARKVYLPALSHLASLFVVTGVHDISKSATIHYAQKFPIKHAYDSSEALCASDSVDVVFILTPLELNADLTILALQHNKHVLVENPVALSIASAKRILDAENASKGQVFVAHMKRYSPALERMIQEVGGVQKIRFARVRDIQGPGTGLVEPLGTDEVEFSDGAAEMEDRKNEAAGKQAKEVFPDHDGITLPMVHAMLFVGCWVSEDLSVMREVLGMPRACLGVSSNKSMLTSLFEYQAFAVSYEMVFDSVPRFDSHFHVYKEDRTVKLDFDRPMVKGLPITVTVEETAAAGGFQQRTVTCTNEDAYMRQLFELQKCLVEGKQIKTTVADAIHDLKICQMILEKMFPV